MATDSSLLRTALAWLCLIGIGHKVIVAKPMPPPDLAKCQTVLMPDNRTTTNCCLPVSNNIVDFTLPSYRTQRTRPAAHLVTQDYMNKYAAAVTAMKNLPTTDPWHHMQQANVHCAYCDGAYNQTGYNVQLQVHGSWLFFPFHRAYLYFYERILGKLIGDDTFAIPFWNWDSPAGMTIPSMYVDPKSSLYDQKRDAKHQRRTVCDLNFNGTDKSPSANLTDQNCYTMYKQMITNAKTATLFMGRRYSAGRPPSPGGGSVELGPHNMMHLWTGDPTQKLRENMGTFYSAARDPIFYAHHANIDRMLEIWKTLPGNTGKGINLTDWLDSAFLFWDENKQLVRIKVRDVIDTNKLGYNYQSVPTSWTKCKPKPTPGVTKPPPTDGMSFPIRLKFPVSVEVKRPKISRSKEEKQREEEVLVVDQIQVNKGNFVKFDVYINAGADDISITEESTQFAGSFVNVPMGTDDLVGATSTTRLNLGLTDVLDELNVDRDGSIMVTLIPRFETGSTTVTVGGIRIELSS